MGSLEPAFETIDSIWSLSDDAAIYKDQWVSIAQRAQGILEHVNDRLSPDIELDFTGQSQIDKLKSVLVQVHKRMQPFSGWKVAQSLIRLGDIARALEDSDRALNGLCDSFDLPALKSRPGYLEVLARQELDKFLAQTAGNHTALLNRLQIRKAWQDEALYVVRRELQTLPPAKLHFPLLKEAHEALKRATRKDVIERPLYHLSPYHVDIDEATLLGEGAFGWVNIGRHIRSTVAVKQFKTVTFTEKDYLNYLKEVDIWSRLRHNHIVPMYGACTTPGLPSFIVSEYMKNGNATTYLEKHPQMAPTQMVHEIALGMAYLHSLGVIHGDLKGANILIDDHTPPRACITDFGVSKIKAVKAVIGAQSSKPMTYMSGTYCFMAPEQWKPELHFASDVYGYGMLLYQLFTGLLPFHDVDSEPHIFWSTVIQAGRRLQRPSGNNSEARLRSLTDEMWKLIMDCTIFPLSERPRFVDILDTTEVLSAQPPHDVVPGDWSQGEQTYKANRSPAQGQNVVSSAPGDEGPSVYTYRENTVPINPSPSVLGPPAEAALFQEPKGSTVVQDVRPSTVESYAASKLSIRSVPSFSEEFLAISTREAAFVPGDAASHTNLSVSCLEVLKELRFNMCHLETSYRLNREVDDLTDRVQRSISPQLSYACRFWGQHLPLAEPDGIIALLDSVEILLKSKFLFWLEALSLLGAVNMAPLSLSTVIPLSAILNPHLSCLAQDALQFVRHMFRPISDSAPHVYLSAMMNAPIQSLIRQRYMSQHKKIGRICSGQRQNWDGFNIVLVGHTGGVMSVAFSNDSKRIVSGSADETVRIWDAETGAPVGKPLQGHTDWVQSVSFSNDSKRIVSGSDDKTVRIWDAETGKPVGKPLQGHTNKVQSVSFSHDGMRLVSGSEDKIIRIWNVQSAVEFRQAFCPDESHHLKAYSATDGRRIHVSVDQDTGWIKFNDNDNFLCLAPDLLTRLRVPECERVISRWEMVCLDLSRLVHGERWAECYEPHAE